MFLLSLSLACRPSNCTKDDIEYIFIDGLIARSSVGGFTDIYKGECGIRDGRAICGDPDHWLQGMAVRQVLRGKDCVLQGDGEIRCPSQYGALAISGPFERFTQPTDFVCGVGAGAIRCEKTQILTEHDGEWDPPFEPEPGPEFPSDRIWVDVTSSDSFICGLDEDGRVLCDPGSDWELEMGGRWDRLQAGCALTDRGQMVCKDHFRMGYLSTDYKYPCQGVMWVDRSNEFCFDWDRGASACYGSDVLDVPYVQPKPSVEATQIGGSPRCGLEPGGVIVCGEVSVGDADRPEYVARIRLP